MQSTRKGSGEDWKEAREREKKERRVLGSGCRMVEGDGGEVPIMLMLLVQGVH